jgi:hypothetical protein
VEAILLASFKLDDPVLGVLGGTQTSYSENTMGDRGRSIQIDWSQAGLDQDVELYGFSVRFAPAETEPKEVL